MYNSTYIHTSLLTTVPAGTDAKAEPSAFEPANLRIPLRRLSILCVQRRGSSGPYRPYYPLYVPYWAPINWPSLTRYRRQVIAVKTLWLDLTRGADPTEDLCLHVVARSTLVVAGLR